MNLRPLHDRILIRRIEEKETVKGGIVIPDTAKETARSRSSRRRQWQEEKDGKLVPLDVKAGESHPLRQVFRR